MPASIFWRIISDASVNWPTVQSESARLFAAFIVSPSEAPNDVNLKAWEHPDQHQGPWLHPEEIPAKPYGSYTHSIVDAKPLGEGCRALLKHSAHACAAHKAHASHVAEGDDDIE